MRLVFFLLLSFAIFTNTMAQWELQNPKTSPVWYYDHFFFNEQEGWKVGRSGHIAHTQDACESWDITILPNQDTLLSIFFATSQLGYIGGKHDLYKSYDGGVNWESATDGMLWADDFLYMPINEIYFVDENIGYFCSENFLYYTNDAGQSGWTKLYEFEMGSDITSVFAIDENHISLTTENGNVISTNDGAQNWNIYSMGNGLGLSDVFFTDTLTGWAVGEIGTVIKTIDGGLTWSFQNTFALDGLNEIFMLNSDTGFIAAHFGKIFYTYDSGNSWNQSITNTYQSVLSIQFFNSTNGIAIGWNSLVLKTDNSGISWKLKMESFYEDLRDVYFTDSLTGWAVGTYGIIVKTDNGGSKWKQQFSGTNYTLESVLAIDNQNIIAAGDNGKILRTNNGGDTWNTIYSPIVTRFTEIQFVSTTVGYIIGYGSLVKTLDGGNSFFVVYSQLSGDVMLGIHFQNDQKGWVSGLNSSIINTMDGAQNWVQQFGYSGSGFLSDIIFTNPWNGWSVGEEGLVIRTFDSGNNWNSENLGITEDLYKIRFLNEDYGWICGTEGTLLTTTNAGANWENVFDTIGENFYSVHPYDENNIWVVGEFGTIYSKRTSTPDTTGGSSEINYYSYTDELFSCYPNPVKDKLYLNLSSGINNYSIEIYSELGEKKFKKSQSETINDCIDMSILKPGIYFLVLSTDNKRISKKILKN